MRKNKFFISRIAAYKSGIIFASIMALIGSAAQIFIPNQVKKIADLVQKNINGDIDLSAVVPIVAVSVALIAAYGLLTLIQNLIMSKVKGRMGRDLRSELIGKTDRLPLSFMDRMTIGDLQSRIVNDVDTMTGAVSEIAVNMPANIVKLVLLLVLMFATNVYMTLSLLAATVLGFIATAFVLKKSRPQAVKLQKAAGEVNAVIAESFSGHLVIKAFNCENDMTEYFESKNEKMLKSSRLSRFYSGIVYPIMSFSGNLSYVAVCITAAILFSVNSSNITFGSLAAFILYAGFISTPISEVFNSFSIFQPAAAASDRIEEILSAEELTDPEKPVEAKKVEGAVVFDHVKFGYVPDQIVLHDLSADIKPGQKVAIVGPTGAGKSTFVNLLMRFYEPQGGRILLDGVPIDEMGREYLHNCIGMVLQDTWTFSGTIRQNIVYSTPDVSDERLAQIIDACGLSFFVEALPDGVDTVISEQSEISAGQRQLITIARAMAKDAPVLILDEATSSIDTRTELLIQKAIDKLTEGRTSFVIAHRLSTIRNADCIFVMKDGDVIETGKHEELLEKGGFYKELYYSQFDQEQA